MLPKPRLAPLLATVLLLTAACSDGSSDGSSNGPAEPSTSAASTPSESGSESLAPTEDPEPSSEAPNASGVAFPGVAPATGLLVQEETVELHAPEGWRASPEVSDFSSGAQSSGASLLLIDTDLLVADGLPRPSVEEQGAKLLADMEARGGDYELQEPIDLGGLPAAWVRGTNASGAQEIWLSATPEGRAIEFTMEASDAALRRDPQLFESVLNSWTWR